MRCPTYGVGSRMMFALVLILFITPLQAVDLFSITRFDISGGGGVSTNQATATKLTGNIGQPTAGRVSGGEFSLTGGILGGIVLVQSPGAPRLMVTLQGSNAIISWQMPAATWVLEVTGSLSPQTLSWNAEPQTPVAAGDEFRVTVPAHQGIRFYRLKKQ